MLSKTLPLELLVAIFKYFEKDYKTLYSCIRVNKQWQNINIPKIWKDPFCTCGSIKILINCLLEEDKDFLVKHNILIDFRFSDRPLLYNYARFATQLHFRFSPINGITNLNIKSKLDCLKVRLVKFILDHSTNIKKFRNISSFDYKWMVNHPSFGISFQNLLKLELNFYNDYKFFDKLANYCKNIQILKIDGNIKYPMFNEEDAHRSLAQLIYAQNRIKQLFVNEPYIKTISLSDDLKQAISTHSQSIFRYESIGEAKIDSLIATFQNLKKLVLCDYNKRLGNNYKILSIKSASLPKIEVLYIKIFYQPFLLELSDFLKINGECLKVLEIGGEANDKVNMEKLFQSIAKNCINLEHLTITYNKKALNQELISIFNNCKELKSIQFHPDEKVIDGDRVFKALSLSLPNNLNTIIFDGLYSISDDDKDNYYLNNLMKNWKAPKPLKIKNYRYDAFSIERKETIELLQKYQDLKFIIYESENFFIFDKNINIIR